jgi:hypothetical protein
MIEQPEYLYHYATTEALLGIVKNREIWATDIFHLNDRHEVHHGIEFAINALRGADIHDQYKEDGPMVASMLESVRPLTFQPRVYVSCFSGKADDQSLWRSYCPRGGYAIGFRRDALQALASGWIYLLPCFYTQAEQYAEIRQHLMQPPVDPGGQHASPLGGPLGLLHGLVAVSVRLKNSSFSNEAEWRLVRVLIDKCERKDDYLKDQFRACGARLIPYIRFKLDDDALWRHVRVVVGPCAHMEESVAAIRNLLDWCDCDLVDVIGDRIVPSSSPYRHW